ncbi:T9SS type A sorting domain-containing protein [Vicingaceae bacterium]|nr:T9SS type A sorting domain-containing protein [Vicingaceae bacterium]
MLKLLYILAVIFPVFGFSQTDTITHLHTFGGNNNDNAEEIEATTDGGYIVVGSTSSNSSGNTDIYLLKVDSLCEYEWSIALGGTNNDWGYSVKQTYDKGYIIAASSNSYGNGGYDAVLMKRDSLGNYEWKRSYGGQDWDFAYSVVQTFDSGYVFCGETYNNTNGYSDVYIVKTDPLGDTLWTQTIGGSLVDKGNSVIETSDSNIVVAGLKNTVNDSTQAYIIKLNKNGVLLWDSIYGGARYDVANAVIETNNGEYVTTGSSTSFISQGNLDFYLVRVNNNGNLIWSNFFGNSEGEEAYDLYEDINGGIINVGYTESAGGGLKDAQLFYITSAGTWGGISPTYGAEMDEIIKSFTIGVNGNFMMAGSTNTYGNGLDDMFLVRVDTIYANQSTVLMEYNDIVPISIKEYVDKRSVLLYPNPVGRELNVNLKNFEANRDYLLEIYSIHGRIIKSISILSQKSKIDVSNMSTQLYLYKVVESGITLETGKLEVF